MSSALLLTLLSHLPAAAAVDWHNWWARNVGWRGCALAAGIGVVGLLALLILFRLLRKPDLHIAGRRLLLYAQAVVLAAKLLPSGDKGQAWGGLHIPSAADELFFLIAGSIGSGKTKHLVNWLSTIVANIVPYTPSRGATQGTPPAIDGRLLVFDPKNELFSILHAIEPRVPVINLTASDLRSFSWSIADDITDPASCLEIAEILLPSDSKEQNPFFSKAVRNLCAGVFQDLVLTVPGNYTLRDAILILSDEWYLRQVLERTPANRQLLKFFEPEVTWKSIEATIVSKLAELRIVAAYWHHAKKSVSLQRWVESENTIFVLGLDPRIETALTAVNRLLLKRLSEIVLACPEGTPKRTYLALDELTKLGGDHPVPGLSDLCLRGRGPGARLAVIFQTIESLRKIYTKEGAHELAGQFANKLFLRAEDPAHADWCSEVVGDHEVWEQEVTTSRGPGGTSVSERWVRVKRRLILPSQFMTIAPANRAHGLQGYGLSPCLNGAVWPFTIPGAWVDAMLPKANPFVPGYLLPRPAEHQYLPPFTEADLARLELRPEPPALPRKRVV